jgi:hypothetical protein
VLKRQAIGPGRTVERLEGLFNNLVSSSQLWNSSFSSNFMPSFFLTPAIFLVFQSEIPNRLNNLGNDLSDRGTRFQNEKGSEVQYDG